MREEAYNLLAEHVKGDHLLKHSLAAEAVLRSYAGHFNEDTELWGMTGLVHDFDYEEQPDQHPTRGCEILKELGYPEELVTAVLGHGEETTGVKRESQLAKALYAVDELTGFILAICYVRPNGIEGLKPKSVKKKLKDRSFAAKVNRDDIEEGIAELGVDRDEHIARVVEAMQGIREQLEV